MSSINAGLTAGYLLLAALLLAHAPASADVLMSSSFEEADPDFRDLPRGWLELSIWGDTTGLCAWVQGEGHSGERCVRIGDVTTRRGYQYMRLPVQPDDAFRLTAWVRTYRAKQGAVLALRWFDSRIRPLAITTSRPITDADERWVRCVLEAAVPPEAAFVSPCVLLEGSGAAWFDDVRLYRTPGTHARWLRAELPDTVAQGSTLRLRLWLAPVQAFPAGSLELTIQLIHVSSGAEVAQKRIEVPAAPEWPRQAEVELGPFELTLPEYAPLGRYRVVFTFTSLVLDEAPAVFVQLVPRRSEGREPTLVRLQIEPMVDAIRVGQELPVVIRGWAVKSAEESLAGYLWLESEDARVYCETTFELKLAGQELKAGQALLAIPHGLPPGTYVLRADLRGHARATGEPAAKLSISGPSPEVPLRSMTNGVYVDELGCRHRWYVDRDGQLIWDGQPWIPIGGVVASNLLVSYPPVGGSPDEASLAGFREATRRVAAAGVRDVLLSPTPLLGLDERPVEATQRIIDRFEELGLRYGLQLGGAVDEGFTGWLVSDQFYAAGVPAGQERVINIRCDPPPGETALAVACSETTGRFLAPLILRIAHPEGSPVGVVSFTIGAKAGGDTYSVSIVPQVRVPPGRGVGDIWTNFGRRRAQVLDFLSHLRTGAGLRFLLDPLCSELQLRPVQAIPIAESDFHRMFAEWLEQQYGDVKRLKAAWGIEGDLSEFQVAARLVPVPMRGHGMLAVDPEGGYGYPIPSGGSSLAADLESFREQSIAEMLVRLCYDIRHQFADVPMLFTRRGETRRFFLRHSPVAGPAGIASQPFGGPDDLARMDGVMAVAEGLLSEHTVWPVACGTREYLLPPPGHVGYSSRRALVLSLDQLARLGYRGVFCLAACADGIEELEAFDLSQTPEQLNWLAAYANVQQPSRWQQRPNLLFTFPAARPPLAEDLAIPGAFGLDGNYASRPVVSLGPACFAAPAPAILAGCPEQFVAWLPEALADLAAARDLDAAISRGQRVCCVGHRTDLGTVPALDSWFEDRLVPVAEGTVQALRPTPDAEVVSRLADGTAWHIRRGSLAIVARWPISLAEAWQAAGGESSGELGPRL